MTQTFFFCPVARFFFHEAETVDNYANWFAQHGKRQTDARRYPTADSRPSATKTLAGWTFRHWKQREMASKLAELIRPEAKEAQRNGGVKKPRRGKRNKALSPNWAKRHKRKRPAAAPPPPSVCRK
jgi:hypothetical protein